MSIEYHIREMRREDLEQVTSLEASCFSMPWKYKDFEDTLTNPNRFYFVADTLPYIHSKNITSVIQSNSCCIIGGCMLTSILGEGDISNVAVHEKYRKQNIATSLLNALMSFGRTHCGITAFTLEVRSKNAPAVRLYEKLGFVTEGVRRNYYEKPKDDALIMWKKFCQ